MGNLESDSQANYERFVREARAAGAVWGLQSDRGWAVCESGEYADTDVYPFWSQEREALAHCSDDWAGYRPGRLDLDEFVERWLAGMSEDGVLVGTNWDAELSGLEVDPEELAEDLAGEDPDDDEDFDDDDERD